jgi:hypothetical protein
LTDVDARDQQLQQSSSMMDMTPRNNNCGPFLDAIMSFVERQNLPFEHIDVWVPSFKNADGGTGEMRLFHAGYVTRGDLDPARFAQLNEYGEYSTKFSFKPGCGLPGRVYTTGEPSWERRIGDADPTIFERAGGASVYNVNTGFGIPLSTPVIARMVVVMYSRVDVVEDPNIIDMCRAELGNYAPEPKWKLVIEMPGGSQPTQHGTALRHRSSSISSGNSFAVNKMAASNSVDPLDEEHTIATLLGDHIPLTELPETSSKFAPPFAQPNALIPHFMSLRLLLLRSRDKRSADDNDAIEIIRKSYRGYARDSRRSENEVAYLLVRDWQFLQQSAQSAAPLQMHKPPSPQPQQYTSYQFNVPHMSTFASTGAPTRMPSVLSFVDPAIVCRKSKHNDPFGDSASNTATAHGHNNVNIVDESMD